jgi:hypothetical protein
MTTAAMQLCFGMRDLAEMHGISIAQARTATDSLGAASIPRVNGRDRVLPPERLEEFRAELRRRGWWTPPEAEAARMADDGCRNHEQLGAG